MWHLSGPLFLPFTLPIVHTVLIGILIEYGKTTFVLTQQWRKVASKWDSSIIATITRQYYYLCFNSYSTVEKKQQIRRASTQGIVSKEKNLLNKQDGSLKWSVWHISYDTGTTSSQAGCHVHSTECSEEGNKARKRSSLIKPRSPSSQAISFVFPDLEKRKRVYTLVK